MSEKTGIFDPALGQAPSSRRRPGKAPRRDRDAWLATARKILIESGVDRVKVEPLAGLLGVTTGSFYHHYKSRQQLLDDLLEHWRVHNTKPMFDAVNGAGSDPYRQFDALVDIWVDESDYDPAYDAAVRAWAHTSEGVKALVRDVDERRIELIREIFERFGYGADQAFIRARITYFHQVGYQAMEIVEPRERRDRLRGLYREALVGRPGGIPHP